MKLSDLTSKTKPVTLDYNGEIVTMTVRCQLITPKLIADLGVLDDLTVDSAERMHAVSEHLARLVASWDVLEDDGSMFPLDVDRLTAEIPVEFQMRCLLAAVQVMQVGEAPAPEKQAKA
jgi:hypothetical protein